MAGEAQVVREWGPLAMAGEEKLPEGEEDTLALVGKETLRLGKVEQLAMAEAAMPEQAAVTLLVDLAQVSGQVLV